MHNQQRGRRAEAELICSTDTSALLQVQQRPHSVGANSLPLIEQDPSTFALELNSESWGRFPKCGEQISRQALCLASASRLIRSYRSP